MLIFIDESWQETSDKKFKVGVLSAVAIPSKQFNDLSYCVFRLKCQHLGHEAGNVELKGKALFRKYLFRLERKGIPSRELALARDIFQEIQKMSVPVFASITFEKDEIDLACANISQLDRPFFYLFERINQFMHENCPTLTASVIFDDRGLGVNQRVSKAVSNFLQKSQTGRKFDRIVKVPVFAISEENTGIQVADMVGYVIGRRFTGDRGSILEFFKKIKEMEFESQLINEGEFCKPYTLRGIKRVSKRAPK